MFGLLGSLLTFQFSWLQRADSDDAVQSKAAWHGFATVLGCLFVLAVLVPQLVTALTPTPHPHPSPSPVTLTCSPRARGGATRDV